MKISDLIAQLLDIKRREGDIQVTCTGTSLEDGHGEHPSLPDVYETTAENLVVGDHPRIGRRVRIYL